MERKLDVREGFLIGSLSTLKRKKEKEREGGDSFFATKFQPSTMDSAERSVGSFSLEP